MSAESVSAGNLSAGSFGGGMGEARGGRLGCACPDDTLRRLRRVPGEGRLALGFALVVLAQALTIGVLPLVGVMLAPDPLFAALPLAVFLIGAAAASLPASVLLDAFGRRAGFALGASLGVAGGLIAAHGVFAFSFRELLVGCAWLGAAQGFGMFYRHAAAFGSGGLPARAVARLMAAGVLAGLAGPALAGLAEALFFPVLFVGTLACAALAQLGVLIFAVQLPPARWSHADEEAGDPLPALRWSALVRPMLASGLAWAAMSAAMSGAPLAFAACGIGVPAVTGFIAWHVVAMYAPALIGGRLAERFGAGALALGGLALGLAGLAGLRLGGSEALLAPALMLVGAGWSLATLGATVQLHESGAPSRSQLAVHDAVILLCALAGTTAGAAVMALAATPPF